MTPRAMQITRPRHDETLYSAMARASRYLGSPRPSLLHQALFGATLPIFDDLPIGVERVAEAGVFGAADLGHVLHQWTLLPFYGHYVSPSRAREAAKAMAGIGRWPHQALGSWTRTSPPPERLRFCRACSDDMLEQHSDLWWRRTHQLPTVLVCPDHGDPLRQAPVERNMRRRSYVAANPNVCSSDAPSILGPMSPQVVRRLLALARMSDALLDRQCDTHPDDRRANYLARLCCLGLLNRAGEAKLPAVAEVLGDYWGEMLELWPGLTRNGCCAQGWLGALLCGERGSPPLHHLLLEGMLAARAGA